MSVRNTSRRIETRSAVAAVRTVVCEQLCRMIEVYTYKCNYSYNIIVKQYYNNGTSIVFSVEQHDRFGTIENRRETDEKTCVFSPIRRFECSKLYGIDEKRVRRDARFTATLIILYRIRKILLRSSSDVT